MDKLTKSLNQWAAVPINNIGKYGIIGILLPYGNLFILKMTGISKGQKLQE